MLDTLANKYRSWKAYRATYNELSHLSNRELQDIGIGRTDIKSALRRATR